MNAISEYKGLRYDPVLVSLNRCNGSCKTLDDLPKRTCVQNKRERFKFICFRHEQE